MMLLGKREMVDEQWNKIDSPSLVTVRKSLSSTAVMDPCSRGIVTIVDNVITKTCNQQRRIHDDRCLLGNAVAMVDENAVDLWSLHLLAKSSERVANSGGSSMNCST